ncbi:amidohydrolase family protein [uncultured Brevundimonas sp.]|uniref:amidohydrolase family protein n=1 Tax=uncultured Brevundimonas sp. TaxID=213418 RepID=UPI0026141B8A|nr:amidohydrolase family protein [uncultured Brevundimonas sp.]
MFKRLYAATVALGTLGLVLASAAHAEPVQVDLIIQNARVVDVAAGRVMPDQSIAIRDGVIVDVVADCDQAERYDAGRMLHVGGDYVMPGLWDNHIHFGGAGLEEENADLLPLFVLNGVTAVRDAAGDLAQTVLEWRAQSPRAIAPRIFTSGPKIEGIAPVWKGVIEAGSEADVDAALDRLQALDVDFVKITDNTLTPELFLYAVSQAKARGMKTSAHIPMELTVLQAAEAGLSTIEHLNYLMKAGSRDEAQISADYIAGRLTYAEAMARYAQTFDEEVALRAYRRLVELGVMASPTQHGSSVIAHLDSGDHSADRELAYVGPGIVATYDWRVERSKQATPQMVADRHFVEEVTLKTLPLLRQAGVRILAGTDAGYLNSYNYPGFSLHDELALYVANGLTPREALEASVINGPALMGQGAHYGSVAAGKVADLIVLEANPLEDIAATRQIRTVVLGGRVHDLEALQQLDADIRAKVAEARAANP